MNRTEHLLTCLAEEAAEVAHRVSKALRFGLDEVQPGQKLTNAQMIEQELNDLIAVADMLMEFRVLTKPHMIPDFEAQIEAKKARVERFMEYAERRGTLRPD